MTPARLIHGGWILLALATALPPDATGNNLTPTVPPPGWAAPAVPRRTPDAGPSPAATAVLDGNAPGTYVSWSTQQSGGPLPSWTSALLLDGVPLAQFATPASSSPGFHTTLDQGPFTVRGGRHTLTVHADPGNAIAETNESDNVWSGQWVWSPLDLAGNTPLVRPAPPARGTLPLPNCDGFRFARWPVNAWVVASSPVDAGDDYDVYAYDDYAGSGAGFSVLRRASQQGPGLTDFVVGHFWQTPNTLYPGIVRASTSGAQACIVEAEDARGREGGGSASFLGERLEANEIVDVFEADFEGGVTYFIALTRFGSGAPVRFEVFAGSSGKTWARGQGAASLAHDASTQTLAFTAQTTGWHPIVVYRNGPEAAGPVTYDLRWQGGGFVDVEEPDAPRELAFATPAPNPARGATAFAITLPDTRPIRLTITDVAGRAVRTLADGAFRSGAHRLVWDTRDDAGLSVPPGLYWAVLEAGERRLHRRIAVVR